MIKLTFLGDVMCKSEIIKAHKTKAGYDFDLIFEKMKAYFCESDYVFANLETPISLDSSDLTIEKFCFNSPYEFAESAFKSGIDFVATANNHCLDRGLMGVKSTVDSLNKIGIKHTGVFFDKDKKDLTVIDIDGLKFGVLSYTYGTNAFSNKVYLKRNDRYMVNMFQNQELSNLFFRYLHFNSKSKPVRIINKIIKKLGLAQYDKPVYERIQKNKYQMRQLINDINQLKENNVDFIIMYMHAGGQYNSEPTEYTKNLTDFLLNNGVDIVAGSHEHVVHGGDFSRIRENKLATYSLGNFDGIAGVYEEPLDKMAEYSIAWNIYYDEMEKQLVKTTFSVLKTIELEHKQIQTVPAYDLILHTSDEKQKKEIINDCLKIARIFSNIEFDNVEKEFEIIG